MSKENRDDFPSKVVKLAKEQAAYICSNPSCQRMTIAPSENEEDKIQYIGVIAHITAASENGPRYNSGLSPEERSDISNALFLCSSCARLIDNNGGLDYPVDTLLGWKNNHQKWVIQNLNKPLTGNSVFVNSIKQKGGINAQVVNIHGVNELFIDKSIKHDIDIFIKSRLIIDEKSIQTIHEEIHDSASCHSDDIHALLDIKKFFLMSENEFIELTINEAKTNFINTIKPLVDFTTSHFDSWPWKQSGGNNSILLRPDYIHDTGYNEVTVDTNRLWRELSNELDILTDNMYNSYKEFRRAVKNKLFI